MKTNLETNIQNECLIAVGAKPEVMIWRNQTGVFRAMDNPDRVVKVGQKGAPDTLAVVGCVITQEMVGKMVGLAVAIEFKTPRKGSKTSEAQNLWREAFAGRGGYYDVVRSSEEMKRAIEYVASGKAITARIV